MRIPMPNLLRLWRYGMRFKLTDPGKLVLAGALMMAVTGLLSLGIPIYHMLMTLAALLAVAAICSLVFRPRISVSGQFPAKAVAGREILARFTLTNESRLPAYDIALGYFNLPAALRHISPGLMLPRLAPRQSVQIDVRLLPARRGLHQLRGRRCYTTFPFNLLRSGPGGDHDDPLLVLPSFHRLTNVDVPAAPRYQPGGIALTSNIGESPEYIGNRDYRPGDPLRRIDGRAWARLATPVVKEFQEEYYCRIAVVMDTFIPWWRRTLSTGYADLEAAVSLTAAAAEAMSRGEYIIDIFAAGPDLYVFRSGRHTAHFENVLEILACVNHCRSNPFDRITPALEEELHSISSVIFILLDWDISRQRIVRAAAEAGCRTKVIIIRDRRTTLDHGPAEAWTDSFAVLSAQQILKGKVREL